MYVYMCVCMCACMMVCVCVYVCVYVYMVVCMYNTTIRDIVQHGIKAIDLLDFN